MEEEGEGGSVIGVAWLFAGQEENNVRWRFSVLKMLSCNAAFVAMSPLIMKCGLHVLGKSQFMIPFHFVKTSILTRPVLCSGCIEWSTH